MTADGPSAATGHEAKHAGRGEIADAPRERRYDAFVVRLWHEPATGRLLRAEVEHVTTGERSRAVGPGADWILDQIRACLDERLRGDEAAKALGREARSPPPNRPGTGPDECNGHATTKTTQTWEET
jgi:hypothetical protein